MQGTFFFKAVCMHVLVCVCVCVCPWVFTNFVYNVKIISRVVLQTLSCSVATYGSHAGLPIQLPLGQQEEMICLSNLSVF